MEGKRFEGMREYSLNSCNRQAPNKTAFGSCMIPYFGLHKHSNTHAHMLGMREKKERWQDYRK
jgi:hypothetical protein